MQEHGRTVIQALQAGNTDHEAGDGRNTHEGAKVTVPLPRAEAGYGDEHADLKAVPE